MENIIERTELALVLDRDDKRNLTGMELKVWKVNKGTGVLVQLLQRDPQDYKKLLETDRTVTEVDDLILGTLKNNDVIKDISSWTSCSPTRTEFQILGECQGKKNCFYFAWLVKPVVLTS